MGNVKLLCTVLGAVVGGAGLIWGVSWAIYQMRRNNRRRFTVIAKIDSAKDVRVDERRLWFILTNSGVKLNDIRVSIEWDWDEKRERPTEAHLHPTNPAVAKSFEPHATCSFYVVNTSPHEELFPVMKGTKNVRLVIRSDGVEVKPSPLPVSKWYREFKVWAAHNPEMAAEVMNARMEVVRAVFNGSRRETKEEHWEPSAGLRPPPDLEEVRRMIFGDNVSASPSLAAGGGVKAGAQMGAHETFLGAPNAPRNAVFSPTQIPVPPSLPSKQG